MFSFPTLQILQREPPTPKQRPRLRRAPHTRGAGAWRRPDNPRAPALASAGAGAATASPARGPGARQRGQGRESSPASSCPVWDPPPTPGRPSRRGTETLTPLAIATAASGRGRGARLLLRRLSPRLPLRGGRRSWLVPPSFTSPPRRAGARWVGHKTRVALYSRSLRCGPRSLCFLRVPAVLPCGVAAFVAADGCTSVFLRGPFSPADRWTLLCPWGSRPAVLAVGVLLPTPGCPDCFPTNGTPRPPLRRSLRAAAVPGCACTPRAGESLPGSRSGGARYLPVSHLDTGGS